MFGLSCKTCGIDSTSDSFDKYYMPLVDIEDFNVLIDNKSLTNLKKTNKKHMKNLSKYQANNDYTTGNLLDYSYHQNYSKPIGIIYQNKQIRLLTATGLEPATT